MDMHPVSDPSQLVCCMRARDEDGLVILQGEVSGPTAQTGQYRLRLIKRGPAGQAEIGQGGAFSLTPGHVTMTGATRIGLEPGARLTAILTLETAGGRHECRYEQTGAERL